MSMTTRQPTTPETAAALQMLYAAADRTTREGRHYLFGAIVHLTGMSLAQVMAIWKATR